MSILDFARQCAKFETTYSFVMLAECSVDDAAVEKYLRCIGYIIECLQRLPKLIIIVVPKGGDPSLDLLGGS